jgi:ankyrin repeat protein
MSVAPLPPPSQEEAIAAAREGREQVLSEWLHHNLEQINDPVDDGYTLLHLAAEEGHVAAVQVLLSLGAAMDTVRSAGPTGLTWGRSRSCFSWGDEGDHERNSSRRGSRILDPP